MPASNARTSTEPSIADREIVLTCLVGLHNGKMKFGAKDGMLQSSYRLAELLGGLQ